MPTEPSTPDPSPSPPLRPTLSAADWSRVSALFDASCDLPATEQAAYQARVQAEQPALAPWLQELLAAHAARTQDDWLERGPSLKGRLTADPGGLGPGQRVGPWVLGEALGSGGMATVWRATKADALPAREVALKLPLSHRAGSQLAERFAREQVILARLTHPHIATLYDAGVAEDGTPWLAMECVKGAAIDRWCRQRRLGVAARVALFMQVLDAVQYAHSRLVIHRDLKPGNILVTDEGQVRLLDFGIAKLLADEDDGAADNLAGLTQAAGQAMTPAYAAPEQLLGQPLTTATDIYALGVVLFELLAGATPYRLGRGSSRPGLQTRAQMEAAVAEGQVRLASQSVTAEAAQQRSTSARQLSRSLRGDLDTVLAKAMHQEGLKRYASASEFADDLRRWTQGEPVRAQRTSRVYRLRRFVQRHWLPLSAAAAVFVALLGAVVVSLFQVQQANQQREQALAQRGRGLALSVFLLDQMVVMAQEGNPQTVPSMLARAEANARSGFAGQANELAEALFIIGAQRRNFEGAALAAPVLAEAKEIASDPDLRALVACDHAAALYAQGQRRAALAQVQEAMKSRINDGVRSMCADYDVLLQMAEGDLAQALKSAQLSVQVGQQAPDLNRRAKERGRMIVAYLQALNGSGIDPDPTFRAMLDGLRAAGTERSLIGIELRSRWATAHLASGNARDALRLIEDNLDGIQDHPESPMRGSFLRAKGVALEALGHDTEALASLNAAAARARQSGDGALLASARCLAAPLLLRQGDSAQAASALAEGLASAGADARAISEPARACAMARAEIALAEANGAAAQAALKNPLADPMLQLQHRWAALLLRARAGLVAKDFTAAASDAQAALDVAIRLQGPRTASFRRALALAIQADVLSAAGDAPAAQRVYAQAAEQFAGSTDANHPQRQRIESLLKPR